MSGKFISSGTLDKPTERDSEWLRAEQELEDRRREREKNKAAHDGKTLYEVLQENKAAKEEAFQESIKLKNQFRALNDDEAQFLQSQVSAAKAKELVIQQETTEQLELFRQKQDATNKLSTDAIEDNDNAPNGNIDLDTDWTSSKKRKRTKDKESIKGLKVRRGSPDLMSKSVTLTKATNPSDVRAEIESSRKTTTVTDSDKPTTAAGTGLGLVGYDSEEEDD